jgi:hypothetical protein
MYKENKKLYKKYLFNFSSSYSGGGLKRLMSYIEWFNKKGGAHFIVNDKLRGKLDYFSKNTFHYVSQTHFQKLINTQRYVDDVIKVMRKCDVYYSYNIPIKQNGAKIKWFHLSNVLPFTSMSKFNIPLRRRIELSWLGILTKRGLQYSDFVSAESNYSLQLLSLDNNTKSLVSVNGSDQEIDLISSYSSFSVTNNIAVIVGTYHHKNIIDSYRIYRHLKADNRELKLIIIGDIDAVPQFIRDDPQAVLKGVIHHDETIKVLAKAAFYINTSQVENSWNAASEGVFLAKESFISKIPPHCELLQDSSTKIIDHLGTLLPIMNVSRDNLNSDRLETWDEIIITMDEFINKQLSD